MHAIPIQNALSIRINCIRYAAAAVVRIWANAGGKGTATFMIGGAICTRSCKFCNTLSGKPLPLDAQEP